MKRKPNTLDLIIDKPEFAGRFPNQFFLSANDLEHLKNLKEERFDGCYIRNVPVEKLNFKFFAYLNNLLKDDAMVQVMLDQPIRSLQNSETRSLQMNAKFSGFDNFSVQRQDVFEQLTEINYMGQVVTFSKVLRVFNEDFEKYYVPAYVPKRLSSSIGRKKIK